ncbi:hypothetical protein F5J12DRAFT_421798 [Pisolithus orientalis]|uniref:uncharacterized protein n=1 Tax=Pisolithus orientalis TaxID=936130 RepID=UPI0022252A7A|nr:uncharacterized protein F5J12DRAFT_421798 [Pisolithus orientalis]KAI5993777.1 hypothetical protein F5J12DRAFT_421798 [Pisolithus orientalis]
MNFGIPITNDFLRTLPEYKGKSDSQLTAQDRSKVAMQQRDVYVSEAVKRLDLLKSDYGNGVSTLCRFYNASGDPIKVNFDHSWRGSFYKDSPPSVVENGQWTTFIHVHPTAQAVGSAGAVIYRTTENTDIFIGWQNPWNTAYDPTCWAESKEKDHWWAVGSESYMLHLLDDKANNRHEDSEYGYKVSVQIGSSTTSECIAMIEKI